jgi:hypothetical protein
MDLPAHNNGGLQLQDEKIDARFYEFAAQD